MKYYPDLTMSREQKLEFAYQMFLTLPEDRLKVAVAWITENLNYVKVEDDDLK